MIRPLLLAGAIAYAGSSLLLVGTAAAEMRLQRSAVDDGNSPMPTIPTPKFTLFGEPLKPNGRVDRKLQKSGNTAHAKPKPVNPMKDLRARLVAGKTLTDKQLVRLADSGDSLGAFHLARKLEIVGDAESTARAARYYLSALAAGKTAAELPLTRLLEAGALADDDKALARAEKLLNLRAGKGSEIAVAALTRMYRSGTPFGADTARADALETAAAEAGDAKAALAIALAALSGTPDHAARERARHFLAIAAKSDILSTRAIAENLLAGLDGPQLTLASETVK